ncbi:uncharacterized protein OCT59_013347 [Rhizophagus irregularis]|nr:hypothetical protein OCT59_013347 [Rhizophagus irregularis]
MLSNKVQLDAAIALDEDVDCSRSKPTNGNEEKSTNQKEHTVATSAFIESVSINEVVDTKWIHSASCRLEEKKAAQAAQVEIKSIKTVTPIEMYEYNTVEKFDRKYKRTGEVPNPFAVSSSDEEDIKEGKKRVMGKQGDRSKAEEEESDEGNWWTVSINKKRGGKPLWKRFSRQSQRDNQINNIKIKTTFSHFLEPKVSSDMPLRKWYQILCQRNPHFESYQRPYNNSWLVFDKSVPLEALDIHNELVTSSSSTTTPYLALTVHNYPKDNSTSTWVPLLVGYTVIILWKKKLLRLAITKDSNNNLIYMYEDYEDDISLTDCVHRSSHRNFFHGLIHYLNIDGRVSIPALIGLNILEIVIQLRNVINMTFPNLFTQVKQAHNAIVTTNRIKNKMKRKASSLCENLENNISTSTTSNTVKINSGILISSNGLPMTPKSTQALVCEYASELNEKRNLKKKLKRTENKLVEHEQAMNPFIVNLQENKENIESKVSNLIQESNIGTTMLINTDQFLRLVLSQPCSQCFTMLDSKRQYSVCSIGFTFKVSITCDCGKYTEYSNETSSNFSLAVASSGLVGGINRQSLEMILATLGITQQLTKKSHHENQKKIFHPICKKAEESANKALRLTCEYIKQINEKILPVSFDVSWSHVRNANQASREFIFSKKLDGYPHRPILGFYFVKKSRKCKKNGESVIVHKGNHDKSSRQMEHAILIAILQKVTPILEEFDLLLDIGIDGDLESNKTLGTVAIVNQIFADLKHVAKLIRSKIVKNVQWRSFEQVIMQYFNGCIYAAGARKADKEIDTPSEDELKYVQVEGLVRHLCGNHSLCWPEVCWIKENPDIELKEPNLITYTENQRYAFRQFLLTIFQLPKGQGLVTEIRTSSNESFNRTKLVYLSKLIDYWKSFAARYSLAVIQNNEGIANLLEFIYTVGVGSYSENDIINIRKIQEERQANRERNNEKLAQKTKEKGEKILNQRNELESFDFSQELVPYGRQFQKRIQQYEEFTPSFACYIKNFSTTVKCICCRSFPKYTSSGLCKLYQFILQHIFQFSSFRLYQREVIQSYTQGQDVFALIQTGGGKTFCYAASSLIFSGLTVVISPLKALILDQVNELIKVGIPCAGLYATTGQSLEYQEKVFQEIASKMLKILLITPEKLMLNQGFRNMLRKVHGEIGVRFVIDEAHCILEYNHYRPEWGKLGCLKEFFPSTSILLLTATCSQDDAESTRERNLVEIAKIVNEISDGQCIIYCSSPGICNEILPLLQDKLKGTAIGTYHGGLESFERDQVMLQWKSRLLKVMIATNAFGLGVNSPNIRTVVHYTFPSSISNFIQESGRAGRDGNPAQSILFYSRNDIKTVYTIITGGRESDFDNNESTSLERTQYLNKGQRKIFEMVTYCESIYECRAQQLAAYHSWQSDSKIPRCTKCDCCINYFKDLPKSENIKNDVIHLLKVIIAVTEFLGMRNQLTLPIDIIHVFAKANNNNIKEKQLSSLPIYKQDYNKTLRRFEDISRLLDNLIIKNLVKVRIDLKKVNTSTSSTQLSGKVIIEGITENAIEIAQNRCWSFLLK